MAAYAHWIEHIVSNMFPVLFGMVVLGAPMSTGWIIFATTTIGTLGDHSGNDVIILIIQLLIIATNFLFFRIPFAIFALTTSKTQIKRLTLINIFLSIKGS
jgi:hypothetical protein